MLNTSRKSLVPLVAGFALLLISGLIVLFLLIRPAKNKAAIKKVIESSEWRQLLPLIIAQSQLETANFKSNVYLNNNNLFGMKVPSKRKFLGSVGSRASDGGNYAAYSNDVQSVRDYVEWLKYVNFPTSVTTPESFARALKQRGYFTANEVEYVKALKSWLE